VFTRGDYQSLDVRGPHRDHIIAFARRHGGKAAITVVTKTLAPISQSGRVWPRGDDFDGVVNLGGCAVEGFPAEAPLSQLFRDLPVAVLRAKIEAVAKPKRKRARA